MNSYELSRNFFDWCYENTSKIRPIHAALYFFAIEHNNRLGWKKEFGLPRQMAMDAIGVKNDRTYTSAFNDLEKWGFFKVIERSKNQYSANIISLSVTVKNTSATTKALSKAMQKHSQKQRIGIVGINKPINQLTNKPENGENLRAFQFLENKYSIRFQQEFQMRYFDKINNQEKFIEDFNDTVDKENLDYTDKILFSRLGIWTRNWIENQNRYSQDSNNPSSQRLSKLI